MRFKSWVNNTLTIITFILVVFLVSINDFSWSAFPFLLGVFGIVIFNIWALEKYGNA